MVMSDTDRLRCAAQIQRDRVLRALILNALSSHTKANLRAVVNAIDDWIETPQVKASFNGALPEPFKADSTAQQKTLALAAVLMRKAGRLPAEED